MPNDNLPGRFLEGVPFVQKVKVFREAGKVERSLQIPM